MSKKANLTTLRLFAKKAFVFSVNHKKEAVKNLFFIQNFIYLLQQRGYWVLQSTYLQASNLCKLFVSILITQKILYKLKKKKRKQSNLSNIKKNKFNQLSKLFSLHISNINILLKITILNKYSLKNFRKMYCRILKQFKKSLFNRKLAFYFDTVKLLSLFNTKNLHAQNLIYIFSNIFQHLTKKLHNAFFKFVKFLSAFLIRFTARHKRHKLNKIKGIKFRINGRIKGKMRASSFLLSYGSIPNQTIEKNIEYAKTHLYTRYGAFGMHMWLRK